jgi:predicted aconitase with swiveling domain
MTMQAAVLLPGPAVTADSLILTAPISFWGGVDPTSGTIADPRHPQHGADLSGKVVMIPATVGSSSASAILLELVHAKRAPAAIVLHEPDAILLLGLVVAKEMGYVTPIALQLDRERFAQFDEATVDVSASGTMSLFVA